MLWNALSIDLSCARGSSETLGEFDQAQYDYTQALDAAREMNNRAAEWQSAIDLGFLWAGRDYAQAEIWFRQALILSQALDDPVLHARSLNRIGNWHHLTYSDRKLGDRTRLDCKQIKTLQVVSQIRF